MTVLQPEPCQHNAFLAEHIKLLHNNLMHWTGRTLMTDAMIAKPETIYHAPFALLSHGTESDPIINYANLTAQRLFEMTWSEMMQLPSRLSAESVVQSERDSLLKRVSDNGYIDDYSGVRISRTGTRFHIAHATVWNLLDQHGNGQGQAAMFADWQTLEKEAQSATLGA